MWTPWEKRLAVTLPCPVTQRVPGAAGTSRRFPSTPVVLKIDISYSKHFSLFFIEMVTQSRVKICYSLLCFPLGNTLQNLRRI